MQCPPITKHNGVTCYLRESTPYACPMDVLFVFYVHEVLLGVLCEVEQGRDMLRNAPYA